MKGKYLILASLAFISVSSFAQKEELKTAEKALKSGNSAQAKTTLQQAEALIVNADVAQKAQFYFLKGNTYLDLANKKVETGKNLQDAAKAYQDLIEIEKKSGKSKYSKQAETSLTQVRSGLVNSAIADNESKNYKEAAAKLFNAYALNKKDTIYLYYAASSAVNGQDYDTAIEYYEELSKLGFTGKSKTYTARNKATGEIENFGDNKNTRDLMIKGGSYTDAGVAVEGSKKAEIIKNIALIYNQKGDTEKAKTAIVEARKANPGDVNLLMAEANLYLEEKQMDKYEALIKEVLLQNPNDKTLYFNLGVISAQAGNKDKAVDYYKKAIEIDAEYLVAYLNLAILYLDGEKKIVDEMNALGSSAKDNQRYDVLKKERENVYKTALPYLEKAHSLDTGNKDVSQTLLNVYGALNMDAKYDALKAKQ